MIRKSQSVLVILTLLLMAGCASVSKMPINPEATGIDTTERSILVGKVEISNEKAPSHQPVVLCMFLEQDGELLSFTDPTMLKETPDVGKEFLVSVQVKPGKVKIRFVRFVRNVPMLLFAVADLPLEDEIEVPPNSLVYIGNISAVIKQKEHDDDPSAGSMLPLIDQAIAGFSTGTFTAEITDNFDSDMSEFYSKYPYLKDRPVVKMILPNWVHPESRDKVQLSVSDAKH